MARVNIYLPDDLARRARGAGLNVSGLAQAAIESELRRHDLRAWLDEVRADPPLRGITHEQVMSALDEAREEMGRAADKYVDPERYAAEAEQSRRAE